HTLTCSTTHPLTSTLFPYTTLFRSPLHPREPGPYWHPYRVRYVELWRVHGPARWPGHQVLHAADRAGGWLRGRDGRRPGAERSRSEEHTSELQSRFDLVCRLLLEKN